MPNEKTLGPVSANLILSLYELNKTIFTIEDVININDAKKGTAKKLLHDLVKRKIITRIKPSKYIIIPQELGKSGNYIGNWYVIAREIVKSSDYYISYISAMDIHNMTTHPVIKVYVTTSKQEYKKKRIVGNTTFEFIYTQPKFIWGIENNWVTRSEQVRVSNPERTIIDCLYQPKYCGGILEIGKGLWIQKKEINYEKLIDYSLRFQKNVVIKRLGYILEILNLVDESSLDRLKDVINNKYYILDPSLNTETTYKNTWKIIANIGQEEVKKAVST